MTDQPMPVAPAQTAPAQEREPGSTALLDRFRESAEALSAQVGGETAGCSYELFERRFSDACAPLLAGLPTDLLVPATVIARDLGFLSDDEIKPFGEGVCPLSGIEDAWCHCGRHP